MITVAQRCATDGASHGVDRLDVGVSLVRHALHSGVVVQKMAQGDVDILRLARGRNPISIRVLDLGIDVLEHVAQTDARPGTHAKIDMINITQ